MEPGPTALEHAFVFLFAVVYPTLGFLGFRRLLKRVTAGHPADRPALYRHTIIGHWLLLAAGLYLWAASDRPPALLGFTMEIGAGFWAALAITLAALWFLATQLKTAFSGDREFLDAVAESFGPLAHLLPRTRQELHGFYVVGITAGIAEEILWRGFLLAYLASWFPPYAAALVVILAFGVAHAYQGAKSVPRITLVGAVFTTVYLLSGSIWLPILLHAAVDVLQGRMAFEVISRRRLYAD